MNKDRINSADPRAVLQAAYAALSGAQSETPENFILGVAVLFRETASVLQLDHSELLAKAESITRDADTYWFANVRALRQFI